jgi:hypothetical protein
LSRPNIRQARFTTRIVADGSSTAVESGSASGAAWYIRSLTTATSSPEIGNA